MAGLRGAGGIRLVGIRYCLNRSSFLCNSDTIDVCGWGGEEVFGVPGAFAGLSMGVGYDARGVLGGESLLR